MKKSKETIIQKLEQDKVIPVFYNADVESSIKIVETCYNAGSRVIEFTNRGENAYQVFQLLVDKVKDLPGMILGIGTIMDGPTTRKFIDAGADFVVSPILNEDSAVVCHEKEVPWMPGCFTLTEMVKAQQLGAEIIKLFPGSTLGPDYLRSILPVVPTLKLMITGGVMPTRESISSWLNAGAVCVGMGSNMIDKTLVKNKDWKTLEKRIRESLSFAGNDLK